MPEHTHHRAATGEQRVVPPPGAASHRLPEGTDPATAPLHGEHRGQHAPGAPHGQHRLSAAARRRAVRGTVSVGVVMALAGALFTANARLARGADERQPQDLAGLQSSEDARRQRLGEQVADLQAEVDALTQEQTEGLEWQSAGEAYDIASGKLAVTGRGITVQLNDAPADGPRPAGVGADDLVVHQQDLQAVINALWAGGAEAMALMDQRVISTSAFQCIGNVLSLQGRRYSPPYVVTAIGDPDKLRAALNADPAIRAYRTWVDAVGLGWNVTTPNDPLTVPAYDGAVDMTYASVPEGTEILPGLVAGPAPTAERAAAPDEGAAR